MAFQIVWKRVNLGEDEKGDLIIGHRGATLPDDFLDDYTRDALSLIGAVKLVPDEALPSAVEKAKARGEAVEVANTDAEDDEAQAERDIARLEGQLKAARERKRVYADLSKDAEKNVKDASDVAPQASSGPKTADNPVVRESPSTPVKSTPPAKSATPQQQKKP
jgi:hypothetical protein